MNIPDLTGQSRTSEQMLADLRKANLRGGGDGPYDPDMERRLKLIEDEMPKIRDSLSGMKVSLARIEQRIDDLPSKDWIGDRIDKAFAKVPNEWAMARVVFYVVGALMAAAIFGPRLMSALPPPV